MLRKTLFRKYKIRDCVVRVLRLNNEEIVNTLNSRLTLKPTGTVVTNSNISWFPASKTIGMNSVAARSSLVAHRNQNATSSQIGEYFFYFLQFFTIFYNLTIRYKQFPTISVQPSSKMTKNGVPTKRPRAKSMVAEREVRQKKQTTMDDLHKEFKMKYSSPHRGLNPVSTTIRPELQPKEVPLSTKIFDEIKAKLQAKLRAKGPTE